MSRDISNKETSKYNSRKFSLTVGVIFTVLLDGLIAAYWPAFRSSLETVVTAQVTALGLYLGVNLGTRWVSSKIKIPRVPEPDEEDSVDTSPSGEASQGEYIGEGGLENPKPKKKKS